MIINSTNSPSTAKEGQALSLHLGLSEITQGGENMVLADWNGCTTVSTCDPVLRKRLDACVRAWADGDTPEHITPEAPQPSQGGVSMDTKRTVGYSADASAESARVADFHVSEMKSGTMLVVPRTMGSKRWSTGRLAHRFAKWNDGYVVPARDKVAVLAQIRTRYSIAQVRMTNIPLE